MTFCYLCRLNVRICGRIRSGERGERIKVLEALENLGSLENLENLPRGRIGTIYSATSNFPDGKIGGDLQCNKQRDNKNKKI